MQSLEIETTRAEMLPSEVPIPHFPSCELEYPLNEIAITDKVAVLSLCSEGDKPRTHGFGFYRKLFKSQGLVGKPYEEAVAKAMASQTDTASRATRSMEMEGGKVSRQVLRRYASGRVTLVTTHEIAAPLKEKQSSLKDRLLASEAETLRLREQVADLKANKAALDIPAIGAKVVAKAAKNAKAVAKAAKNAKVVA